MSDFKVGDRVRVFNRYLFGIHKAEGIVEKINSYDRSLAVRFDDNSHRCVINRNSSFFFPEECRLVERPKKKIKIEFYQRIMSNGKLTSNLYSDCNKQYAPKMENKYIEISSDWATDEKYGEPIVLEIEE